MQPQNQQPKVIQPNLPGPSKAKGLNPVVIALAAVLFLNLLATSFLFIKVGKKAEPANSSATKSTPTSSSTSSTQGLKVDSVISPEELKSLGSPNLRLGLLDGAPGILLEDKNAQQWSISLNGAALQFAQPGAVYAQIDKNGLTENNDLTVKGNTVLGDNGADKVTLQASSLSIPNGLNINNALTIETNGNVAIGANSAAGAKLLVAGTLKVNSSITASGAITAPAGSAKTPAIAISNNGSGLFSPGANITSVAANGTEVLRVQPGNVSTVGAGLTVNGFLQSGESSPAWKVNRYTGTLDAFGSASIGHGIANAHTRVLTAGAWYRGSGGEARPLSIDSIDGSNLYISGGAPNTAIRITVIYSADSAGW
jgi:hypothetical protein